MLKIIPLFHHITAFLKVFNIFAYPVLLLALGISIGLALALYHILKNATARQKVDISLEKLSYLWKSQDEISLNLKKEIIDEIKAELGFAVNTKINNKNRLKLHSKEEIKKEALPDIKNHLEQVEPESDIKTIENKKLLELYNKLEPYLKSDEQNNIAIKLIILLDKKGYCPSVASSSKDLSNNGYKSNMTIIKNISQYEVFKQITLTDHTMNVCGQALDILNARIKERAEQQAFIAPVLIACLAHDVGKLPDLSDTYATGDHPIISSQILLSLGLPQKSDIFQAVLNHHKVIQMDNTVYSILKSADQSARAKELMDYLNANNSDSNKFLQEVGVIENKEQTETQAPAAAPEKQTGSLAVSAISPASDNPVNKPEDKSAADNKSLTDLSFLDTSAQKAPPVGYESSASVAVNAQVFIDDNDGGYSWLNIEDYLFFLKNYLNTFNITKDNKLQIQSVGLSSGVIYFSSFTMGKSLTDYMKSVNMTPLNYKNDEDEVHKILTYITSKLLESSLLDARINKSYYTNSVNIIKKGDIIEGFGILIKLEAFGFSSVSDILNMPGEMQGITDVIITKEKIKKPVQENPDIFS